VQGLRLSNKVVSVTLLQPNGDGDSTAVLLFESKKKKSKSTGVLSVVEKVLEELMDAQKKATNSYQKRFKDSSREKRDGWLIDMPTNVFKAVRDGVRNISLERVL
jgi:hypothetical protein